MSSYPQNNRTYQIIHAAQAGKYAVGGFCVYNYDGVAAVVRAAEANNSPALIQFFPWTIHFQGKHFIQFAADLAHSAKVPIALHLDHCIKPEDAEIALQLPFDSIMVDGSLFDEEGNIAYVKSIVQKAEKVGQTVEAELGRMEGGYKDVLEVAEGSGVFTEPEAAKKFVQETGVHFLAPSFGNVHGPYPEPGAERWWQMDRLRRIREEVGDVCPLVLHGTAISDDLLKKGIEAGFYKVNQNKMVRRRYMKFLAEEAGKYELTDLQEKGVQIYAEEIGEMMKLLGSVGKA
ncbi:fructose-bisphosphate aldolase [Rhizodiscina lignyota]|uniref:Fructose-bisphosphate aldolase n=1 Tax=Rhizodiscina lignyota TaxID=1504668 RepID=A0A9P4M8I3_9PEZI|nr:fructose-bisphosphate aldolase [Rhizodiscina lignyota]